jgi:hypothetical protein
MTKPSKPSVFYHVRVTYSKGFGWDEVKLGLDKQSLRKRVVKPYEGGQPLVINGKTIPNDRIERIRISTSVEPPDVLVQRAKLKQQQSNVVAMGITPEWEAANACTDVTDDFIKGPPGHKRVATKANKLVSNSSTSNKAGAAMPSIFLSHSSKDKFFARKIAQELQAHGVRVWIDEAEINVGDSLTEKIGSAIHETEFMGIVLSRNSVNSNWVQKELQIALNKEIAQRKMVVLPMLLEQVEMPPFLKDKKYADFTGDEKFASSAESVGEFGLR